MVYLKTERPEIPEDGLYKKKENAQHEDTRSRWEQKG
jgi:hypothetical protein